MKIVFSEKYESITLAKKELLHLPRKDEMVAISNELYLVDLVFHNFDKNFISVTLVKLKLDN